MLMPRMQAASVVAKSNSEPIALVRPPQTGTNLPKEHVVEIEKLLIAGESGLEIARRFGVGRRTIWTIDRAMHGPSFLSPLVEGTIRRGDIIDLA
jgi:hypothetical protein